MVLVCGREEPGFTCVPDMPDPNMGPLGGLNAALDHAIDAGFSHVLSTSVDVPNLPTDLAIRLRESEAGQGAAIVESQPVIGLWPVALTPLLRTYLHEGRRSLYGFAEMAQAQRIAIDPPLLNINAPQDLP